MPVSSSRKVNNNSDFPGFRAISSFPTCPPPEAPDHDCDRYLGTFTSHMGCSGWIPLKSRLLLGG